MKSKGVANWIVAVGVLGLSVSCASVPKQAFEKKDAAPVKMIAILPVGEPKEYIVHNIGGPGMAFGLIGGLAEAAAGASKTSQFTQSIQAKKLALGEQMPQMVGEALKKQGYDIVYLSDQRPTVKDDKTLDYSQIRTDADAILHVWFIVVGYMSPQGSPDYMPWIRTSARLVSAKAGTQLYFQVFNYGANLKFSSEAIENLSSDPEYAYRNFDVLMANSDKAAEGMKQGLISIANRIAEHLR